ncbi:Hypothetical predicted protein [Pelobates cultripes]|uniref:Uncharacterized protein n=1 Tax=Pelobates cultripes TaxID=61616 RepID=A0AAD1WT87_PELCU|nr:Hypothetical predicted protein [Pelobates cultripes]
MAPMSPSMESAADSLQESAQDEALAQIRQELAMILEHMLTKVDKGGLLEELRAAVREEISALRTDLTVVEVRVEALETEAQASHTQHRAARLAFTHKGNLLLTLHLKNCSRCQNIRI